MIQFVILVLFIVTPLKSFGWGTTDLKNEAASPFTTNAKPYLITGSVLTIGLVLLDDYVDPLHDKVAESKPLGKFSKHGDTCGQLVPNLAYVGLMLGLGKTERALGMFKATAYASTVSTALKYTIQEPRPNDNSERNSFPSGHTTTAFAFSGYVAAEHGYAYGIPAMALATLVGLSRVNDNKHRFHDVMAGATIGLAYGIGISSVDKKKSQELNPVSVFPLYDRGLFGLTLTKSF